MIFHKNHYHIHIYLLHNHMIHGLNIFADHVLYLMLLPYHPMLYQMDMFLKNNHHLHSHYYRYINRYFHHMYHYQNILIQMKMDILM